MNYKVKENILMFVGVAVMVLGSITLYILLTSEDELVPYQWFWESVIFFIILAPFIIALLVDKRDFKDAGKEYKIRRSKQKSKTKRIRVDLSKCKLEYDSSYERVESNNTANIANHWEGLKASKNVVKNIQKSECTLVFEMDWKGNPVRFESETIFKDEITLRFLLEQKKEIDLYIKPNGRYFFDLDFLLEPHERLE